MGALAYNIDPEQLKAFLVNEGLMLVSLKEVRHMEEAKLARFRAKCWAKQWLTPGQVIKMDVLTITSVTQLKRWCENGTIREGEFKKTTNGIRILTSAVKRLCGGDVKN